MTHHEMHLRLDKAEALLRRLREASDRRIRDAGPQQAKDHDRCSRWLANRLPSYNPK